MATKLTDRGSGTRQERARAAAGGARSLARVPSGTTPRRQTNISTQSNTLARRGMSDTRDTRAALQELEQVAPLQARMLSGALRDGRISAADARRALMSSDPLVAVRQMVSGVARSGAELAAAGNQGGPLEIYGCNQGGPFEIYGGASEQFYDATAGGIKGPVNVLLQATESITDTGLVTIDADVAFSANDQSRVGSVGRLLLQLFVNIAVSGDLPAGYDAESLRQFLIGCTYVQPEIGGVPQSQIPLAAMIDTNFIDRSFGFKALLDPGNFPALNFNWSSDAITPPAAPTGDTWTARLQITAVFSPPLRG